MLHYHRRLAFEIALVDAEVPFTTLLLLELFELDQDLRYFILVLLGQSSRCVVLLWKHQPQKVTLGRTAYQQKCNHEVF